MKGTRLHGMRFSPIYYKEGQHGGDAWLDADETHKLWNKAAEPDAGLTSSSHRRSCPGWRRW
ncbi:MAG: hypothetical protein R3B91_04315 [Planctomycetaceae bacterium]